MFSCAWAGRAVGVNKRLVPGKGRWVLDAGYRAFKTDLTLLYGLNNQHHIMVGDVKVFIGLTVNKARDIDSLVKPVLDALEGAMVFENDRQVVRLEVEKSQKKLGEADRIYVEVCAL